MMRRAESDLRAGIVRLELQSITQVLDMYLLPFALSLSKCHARPRNQGFDKLNRNGFLGHKERAR
jgi:hypothetical protein